MLTMNFASIPCLELFRSHRPPTSFQTRKEVQLTFA